jgi:predicted Fe-S protein YdhL (DUF1289 family)
VLTLGCGRTLQELANDVAQASAVVVKKVATSVQNGLKEAHKLAELRVKRSEEERSAAEAAGPSKRQRTWYACRRRAFFFVIIFRSSIQHWL